MSAPTILCPGCRAALIPAVDWNFKATWVTVPVCAECSHAGLVSVSLPVTGMRELATEARYFRHPEGFVEFPV